MDLKIFRDKTNLEIMDYLSAKIRGERKIRRLSQKDFALLAGISVRTFKRFEQDCNGSVDNFIKVLRAYDKVNFFQYLFIEENQKSRLTPIDRIVEARKKSLSRD